MREIIVSVVEDDPHVRNLLTCVLSSHDYTVHAFGSPDELLENSRPDDPGCMILDLILPQMSGLELSARLFQHGYSQPQILLSGNITVPIAVDAMHHGIFDVVEKPFQPSDLLERVKAAVEADLESRQRKQEQDRFRSRLGALTTREREVMRLVIGGHLTKQIACRLGISPKTVEVHRSHITRKMDVESVAQLVTLVMRNAPELAESTN